jgi:hypothetical protein
MVRLQSRFAVLPCINGLVNHFAVWAYLVHCSTQSAPQNRSGFCAGLVSRFVQRQLNHGQRVLNRYGQHVLRHQFLCDVFSKGLHGILDVLETLGLRTYTSHTKISRPDARSNPIRTTGRPARRNSLRSFPFAGRARGPQPYDSDCSAGCVALPLRASRLSQPQCIHAHTHGFVQWCSSQPHNTK